MFSRKKSNIFRVSSLLSLILFVAFAATMIVNFSGAKFDYATQYDSSEYEVRYQNHETISGKDATPMKIDFVFDSSGSGWSAVVNDGMLDYIRNALRGFADQSHIVEFDGYSFTDGSRSTGAFLPIESEESSKLWRAIDKFEESYREPWGDMPYDTLLNNGIESLTATDDEGEKLLVFIIGSPSSRKITNDQIEEIKDSLSEHNITLYVLGIANKGNNYDVLEKITENVYKEIKVSDIEGILTEVFERTAYNDLTVTDTGKIQVEIPMPSENNALTGVDIRFFSTEPFDCYIEKVTTLEDGRESVTAVESASCSGNMLVSLSDITIEEASDSLKYNISINNIADGQRIYYACDYEVAEIIEPEEKIVKLSIASLGCGLFGLLFIVPIVIRSAIKSKYTKYATACEARR